MNHYGGNDQAGVELGKLCSFRFVDLENTGELSLVAVYDGGGTADCDQLGIYDKGPAGVEEHYYNGSLATTSIKEAVEDINGDGHFELVATLDGGSYCGQNWPSVYAWTGRNYTNVSSQYPRYYRTWLASLVKEIAKLKKERTRLLQATPAPPPSNLSVHTYGFWKSGSAPAPPATVYPMQPQQPEAEATVSPAEAYLQLQIDCKQAQAAKIERFLGLKDAGMTDAIRWANSDDPKERKLAAAVFYDLGTPEALTYERTLAADSDQQVAKWTKGGVESWGKADPYEAPEFIWLPAAD